MSLTTAAEGVHRISQAYVNFYLVEDDEGVTVVDSGLPAMWGALLDSLRSLGRGLENVQAVVLTHAHFDHLGLARRLRREHQVPVWVHPGDAFIAHHPYRYRHERSRFVFSLTHPRACRYLPG
jgi:glyoxylase-like metal-dependent hydrolase (beta-lactamase superfamily II)